MSDLDQKPAVPDAVKQASADVATIPPRSGARRAPADAFRYRADVVAEVQWPALVPAWEALAASALEPAPSAEPWMLLPSLRHGIGGDLVRIVVVRDEGGAPRGVFPLAIRSRRFRPDAAECWNHMYSLSSIPLLHSEDPVGCLAAFFDWFRREMPAGMLLRFPEVRLEGAFFPRLEEALRRERIDRYVDGMWHRAFFRPAADAESYLGGLGNAHHRKEWRRLERRLGERGRLTYDELTAGADPRPWLEAFMDLERASWKGREGTAFASKESHRAWLLEIGTEAAARKRLMMLALCVDGEPVALKLNLLCPGGGHTFKIAYDERLEKFSPGVLLELENLRRMHELPGLAWMDSLAAPGHTMMERVWSGRAAFASLLVAPGRGLGRATLALKPLAALLRTLGGSRKR